MTKKVLLEEKKEDRSNSRTNLREFAKILLIKAELRLKIHEHEMALKPLYKLNRLLEKALYSDNDRDLKA